MNNCKSVSAATLTHRMFQIQPLLLFSFTSWAANYFPCPFPPSKVIFTVVYKPEFHWQAARDTLPHQPTENHTGQKYLRRWSSMFGFHLANLNVHGSEWVRSDFILVRLQLFFLTKYVFVFFFFFLLNVTPFFSRNKRYCNILKKKKFSSIGNFFYSFGILVW